MQVTVTGHRVQYFGGFQDKLYHYKILSNIKSKLKELNPTCLYTGMAQGVDTWAALAADELGIPYYAIIPFADQHILWPEFVQRKYNQLLLKAADVVFVDEEKEYQVLDVPIGKYHSRKMQLRNQYMVDLMHKEDVLLVVSTEKGPQPGSGTYNCLNYYKQLLLPEKNICKLYISK